MNCFVIGTVLEPEERTTQGGKSVCVFGLLVGRKSLELSVFSDDRCFPDARTVVDGDQVCVIVTPSLDKNDRERYYVQRIALCPDEVRESMQALFK